jgi:hypothetical protein
MKPSHRGKPRPKPDHVTFALSDCNERFVPQQRQLGPRSQQCRARSTERHMTGKIVEDMAGTFTFTCATILMGSVCVGSKEFLWCGCHQTGRRLARCFYTLEKR